MTNDTTRLQIALLQAAGISHASGEPLDITAVAAELEVSEGVAASQIVQLEHAGLLLTGQNSDEPVLLRHAGHQFLDARGEVSPDVLLFLPRFIDNLHTRDALIVGGTILVDEFRGEYLHGDPVRHAAELVPPAFAPAADERLAINLYAAAVALMARLSNGRPAGCVAEEILAVRLMQSAEVNLDMRADIGELTDAEVSAARGEMNSLFDLFEDDDVLNMFDMEEPADASLAEYDPVNMQLGVVDQRIENWFRPFGGVTPTGYLTSR